MSHTLHAASRVCVCVCGCVGQRLADNTGQRYTLYRTPRTAHTAVVESLQSDTFQSSRQTRHANDRERSGGHLLKLRVVLYTYLIITTTTTTIHFCRLLLHSLLLQELPFFTSLFFFFRFPRRPFIFYSFHSLTGLRVRTLSVFFFFFFKLSELGVKKKKNFHLLNRSTRK